MISSHRLATSEPAQALAFYQKIMGMMLIAQQHQKGITYYFLSMGADAAANLVLVHDPAQGPIDIASQPSRTEGYWKYSIAVPNLDLARQKLVEQKIAVGPAMEVPDVAYLCHFTDAEGYCVELIQHRWRSKHNSHKADLSQALGSNAALNLSTLRVKDIDVSLRFYQSLGMRLVSRQHLPARGMTLYFLDFSEEIPPSDDINSLDIREWLWQRPYTLLELQHIHGTEDDTAFSYRTDPESGFLGLTIKLSSMPTLPSNREIEALTVDGVTSGSVIQDPDGYQIQLCRQR